MNANNLNIRLDMERQMFFVMVKGGAAYLKYEQPKINILDIKETYVPAASRSNGVAEELVDHVLKYAESKNYRIIPSCPFAKSYTDKNHKYEEVLY